jgi:hypothetical protein|eukprot:scaffold5872_cov202-Alexandrium_tamarense.AAC.14
MQIAPRNIRDYLAEREFGKVDIDVENRVDTPKIRKVTVEFWKKDISYFMTDKTGATAKEISRSPV